MKKNMSEAIPKRHHTRADVEEFFLKHWGGFLAPSETITINDIRLIVGLGSPLWRIRYTTVVFAGTSYEIKHDLDLLLIEEQHSYQDGGYYLVPASDRSLPIGAKSVADENALLRKPRETP